jgi:hypothetical protein
MSNIRYTGLEDELFSIIHALRAEQDVLLRMKYVRNMERAAIKQFRDLKRESAYAARLKYAGPDVAAVTGADNKEIDYWAACHAEAKGLPRITRRAKRDLSDYMDLSGG